MTSPPVNHVDICAGRVCPECDSTDTETNTIGTEFLCRACDHRWGVDCGIPYGYDYEFEMARHPRFTLNRSTQ